jgi:hypothetical protein
VEEKFKCPRCGFEQSPTEDCRKCRVNIPKYLELQKRRRAVPSEGIQRLQEEDQRPGKEPPPEEEKKVPADKQKSPGEKDLPRKSAEISHVYKGDESKRNLTGIGELFERTWDIFKRRVGTLIALYLISIALMIIPMGIFVGIGVIFSQAVPDYRTPLIVAGVTVGIIAGILAGFWGFGSFIFAIVDENMRIKDALEKGGGKIWAFIWLFSLLGYIVPGGFLLFLVPGVIFMVWFAFAQFILPNEGENGMNALLKSKEYVKGYWFDVFGRLFIIWLVSVGISLIPLIGAVLSILFVPFEMIFVYFIYTDLKSIKGDVAYSSSVVEKFKWIGAGTLGYVVVPLIIIAIMGASFISSLLLLKGMLNY